MARYTRARGFLIPLRDVFCNLPSSCFVVLGRGHLPCAPHVRSGFFESTVHHSLHHQRCLLFVAPLLDQRRDNSQAASASRPSECVCLRSVCIDGDHRRDFKSLHKQLPHGLHISTALFSHRLGRFVCDWICARGWHFFYLRRMKKPRIKQTMALERHA